MAAGCGWYVGDAACGRPVVEVLQFCNPLCGGGPLRVCAEHLVEYCAEHLL